ncbi:hypothetical protein [Pseudoduganella aquatica]|uniref:hypothetical protein n=1 Tax=Pseudoduganella aquatica TaxID=2660641 RepID=UPI001E2C9836|nr:hypothetical protein [Pseudoduganella aquatica]
MMRALMQPSALALACALGAPVAALAAPVSHVFLVQNSGWMEPFYTDPASQYKALVTEVVLAAVQPGDALVLAAFNQSLPGAPSPKALLAAKVDDKPQRAAVAAALAPLAAARKPGSSALADTDLGEAVSASITSALGGKPGLIWLFTNNKNSPNNDQATAQRNREFYELIHHGGSIKKALAFPLHMPVHGRYSANGMMIYVFAIQDEGKRELDALLRSGRLQKVITEPPARLKPLDQDTVRLLPVKVENVPGVAFSTQPNGTLRADIDAAAATQAHASPGDSPAARIQWRLENTIYPYTITSARLAARSVLAGAEKPIALGADRVQGLAPGKSLPLASSMQLPVANLPGKWSLEAVQAAGSAAVLPGAIEVQLSEQKLELSQAFRERMAALFPGDPLPDIFTPPSQVQGSRAVLPLEVRMQFGLAPLLALLGGVAALLAGGAALAVAAARPRKVQVTVEGELRTLHVKAGNSQPLFDKAGNKVAVLNTTLFGSTLTDLREGAQVRLGR